MLGKLQCAASFDKEMAQALLNVKDLGLANRTRGILSEVK
jgi:hypothetical protein